MRRMLGGIGRSLITCGTLILLFVVYQLWGTGLQEAKSQRKVTAEFEATLRHDATTTTTAVSASTTTTGPIPTTTGTDSASVGSTLPGTGGTRGAGRVVPAPAAPSDIPVPAYGDPIGIIKIPKIGITRTIVEGTGVDQLKRGPGHYPATPLPGQAGNAAIAGHRTTYGEPFHNIDRLSPGDQILVQTRQGQFVYRVAGTRIVTPGQNEVLLPTEDAHGRLENRITLTSCHPKWSSSHRIVVWGLLVGRPAPELKGQARARERAVARQRATGTDPTATIDGGIDGPPASITPAVGWGIACALIWFFAWLAHRWIRRRLERRRTAVDGAGGGSWSEGRVTPAGLRPVRVWAISCIPYAVGLPIFLTALYVFFENFALLLPANY